MEDGKLSYAEIIRIGTEIGVKVALDQMKQEKDQRRKTRYDRRLRNTKLLLREYRILKLYCEEAIYSEKQMVGEAISILEEIDNFEYDENLYIESIKQSTQRTAIIIAHIDRMLDAYRYLCDISKRPEEKRRHRVICAMYLDDKELQVEEIAEANGINSRTVYKDIDNAIVILAGLIFGIDGLKIY